MRSYSELLDLQSRGEDITPNPDNKLTQRRKAWKSAIIEQAGNDGQTAYDMSLDILGNYVNRLQQFVLEHSEEPAPLLPDLAKQVYQLRMQDVAEASNVLDYDTEQSITHLEENENLFEDENGYRMDGFLGELFAPVEIVYTMGKGDNFIASDVANALIPAIGEKVNKATLIRAAQGKPSGVLGFLSSGGKRHYEALVAYFRANPDTAKKVLAGQIDDESELPGWAAPNPGGSNPLYNAADDLRKDQMKKMLPYIIGFFIILGVIVYFAARSKK